MTYGLNTTLVEEVIEFANGDDLLQGSRSNGNWHVIHDIVEAKQFAWLNVIDPDEYSWTDLREHEMAEVLGRSYEVQGFAKIDSALTLTIKRFTALISRRLDEEHAELLDDIVADLHNCAFNRAVDGAAGFFEEVFAAYRAGGWPCGWSGIYPMGQLVVYMRQSHRKEDVVRSRSESSQAMTLGPQ